MYLLCGLPGLYIYCLDICGAHYIGNEIMATTISSPFIFIITKAGPTYYVRNGVSLGSCSDGLLRRPVSRVSICMHLYIICLIFILI